MKRTALKRYTRLQAKSWPKGRGRIAPRSTRTISNEELYRQIRNPFSLFWRDQADKVWSFLIILRSGGRSEFTGREVGFDMLEPHHIVRRDCFILRHDLQNGIALNALEHRLGVGAPHSGQQPHRFNEWFHQTHPERWEYLQEHRIIRPLGVDYQEAYFRLINLLDSCRNLDVEDDDGA